MLEKLDGETFCVREFRWPFTRKGLLLLQHLENLTEKIGEDPNLSREVALASCEMVSLISQVQARVIPEQYNFLGEFFDLPRHIERPLLAENLGNTEGIRSFILPRVFFRNIKIIKEAGNLERTELAIDDVFCFTANLLLQASNNTSVLKKRFH